MTRPSMQVWMVAGLLLAGARPAWAQSPITRSNAKMLAAFKEVVAKPSESTVRILGGSGKQLALGAIVTPDGYVITKGSLLRGKLMVQFKNGKSYPASYVALEPKNDLALLKVESGRILPPVEWRDSRTAQVGDWVAAATAADLPVAVGVVGVATRFTKTVDFMRDPAPANSGYLGVYLEDGDNAAAVGRVDSGTPAGKAGIKAGDQILKVDDKRVTSMTELMDVIQSRKAGVTVVLRVKRGKEETDIKVELGKRPAGPGGVDRGDMQNRMGSELSKKRSGFPEIFQTDIVIKPSDCGGPAVDLDGKAVGVNIARGGRTESYVIPSEVVVKLLPDLQSGKYPAPKDDSDERVRVAEKAVEDAEMALETAKKAITEAEKAVDEARKEGDPSKSIGAKKLLTEKKDKAVAALKARDEAKKALEDLIKELK